MKKAYLGIDIGSISTKGVLIDEDKNILCGVYLWTEGNPMEASKKVIASLGKQLDQNEYQVVATGQREVPESWWVRCATPVL